MSTFDPDRPALRILAPLGIEARALRQTAGFASIVRGGMGPRAAKRAAGRVAEWTNSHRHQAVDDNHAGESAVPDEDSGGGDVAGAVAIAGFCGGLTPEIQCGDVIVASEVRGPNGSVHLPSAVVVAQALRRAGLTVHVGPIVSEGRVALGGRRGRLGRNGALAVDMESYWLLEACAVSPGHPPDLSAPDLTEGGVPGRHPRVAPANQLVATTNLLVAPSNVCVVRTVSDTSGRRFLGGMLPGGWLAGYRALSRLVPALEVWAAALGPRDIYLATPRSFCGGVNGAIRMTEEALALNGPPVYVLHEIVHNRHVVDSFRERGVVFVPDIADVPEGEMLVFSAHGVGQAEREKAAGRRLRVVDATCPLVARVHAKAKSFAEQGLHVVLIGKKGHDEVKGVMGEVPGSIHLVEGPADIEQLDLDGEGNIAILTQTTLVPHQAESLIAAIEQRFPGRVMPPSLDVCYASQERQEAVRRVAPHCDLMLVIGSPNSSNSKRLVEEAIRMGTPARLVDDETEVDLAWLASVRRLGLTAGASAPERLLERMIAFVGSLGSANVSEGAPS